jgi:bifunctional enzyme CysN/CysC
VSFRIAMVGHVDHGKSTLIGRLLSDTGQMQIERSARVQSLCDSTGQKFEFAFLLDALEEEQSQGITIDVTEVNWRHDGVDYTFVDTPGHREFMKKMIGGASRVEVAVLLLDVKEGVQDSFRRQMLALDLLGVHRRIILVNKMDLVDWSESAWLEREREIRALLSNREHWVLPASAWHGANILESSEHMPWHKGPTFLQALKSLAKSRSVAAGPTRFFVQDVYRWDDKRIYAGRLESGEIAVGDTLVFHPGDAQSKVRTIEAYGENRTKAVAGDAIGFTLEDPLFLDRGALGFRPTEKPLISSLIRGDLFWLDREPIKVGDRLKIKMGTHTGFARVEKIEHEIEAETFSKLKDPDVLNMFGRILFRFEETWAFDRFGECEPTGRFVISKSGQVLGGGRWVDKGDEANSVTFPGSVLWFTGLSGAGKTTVARALEKELQMQGGKVVVLDGDTFRQGLCADLGFSDSDRRENVRRAAHVAKLLADEGFTVITAFISPFKELRILAREIVGASRFQEVFVDCPIEVCEARDVKGLYAKARRGELRDFTGLTSPFEKPEGPDMHLQTAKFPVQESVRQLSALLGGTK